MITELYIENYKCFGSPGVTIPIRPVTFLYGENSSGKTTVIEALKLIQKVLSNTSSVKMWLDDFLSYVNHHDTTKSVILGVKIDPSKSVERLRDFTEVSVFFWISRIEDENDDERIEISKCRFYVGNSYLTFNLRNSKDGRNDSWWLDYSDSKITFQENSEHKFFQYSPALQRFLLVNYIHISFFLDNSKIFPSKYYNSYFKSNKDLNFDELLAEDESEQDLLLSFIQEFETLYPELAENIASEEKSDQKNSSYQEPTAIERFNKYESEFQKELIKVCDTCLGKQIENVLQKINYALRIEFDENKFVHTPPLRPLPERSFLARIGEIPKEEHSYLYNILFSSRIRDRLNFILKELIGDTKSYLQAETRNIFIQADDEYIESVYTFLIWKMFINNNPIEVDLLNIGFGYCQIIPLIVTALSNQGKFITVQQPEVHLHPLLQAKITDVFIFTAIGELKAVDENGNEIKGTIQTGHSLYKWFRSDSPNNYWFIESHSDMVAMRALRRAVNSVKGEVPHWMCKVDEKDVINLFFHREGETIVVEQTELDAENKTFKGGQWAKEGFFPYLMDEYNEFN